MPTASNAASQRLAAFAAGAPSRRPNVRSLAMFAANSTCRLATLGFAVRVDFDTILSVHVGSTGTAAGRRRFTSVKKAESPP